MKSRISDESRIKRGLGKGDENHKPWIRPRDFSSSGRVHRMKLSKAKFTQVALSDLERNYLLFYDFAQDVKSVMSQVALLPLEATQKIAWDLNIKHPADEKGIDRVMTTDILLDIEKDGKIKRLAISIKPHNLITDRVIKKFQIEKEYWKQRGVDWTIVTDSELDSITVNNLLFLRDYRSNKNLYGDLILDFFNTQKSKFINESIGELIQEAAIQNRITIGNARIAFLHLVAKGAILFDIAHSLNWSRNVYDFKIG